MLAVDRTARSALRALGWADDGVSPTTGDPQVWVAAVTVWGLIEGHTRGRGVGVDLAPTSDAPTPQEVAAIARAATPAPDVAAVALAACLRLATNPAQRTSETTTSPETGTHRVEGSFSGFTLSEQLVLQRYRRRVK